MENRANILAYIGASGAGRSTALKAAVRAGRHSRLLVFDPQHEYAAFDTVYHSLPAVLAALQEAGPRGPFAVVFQPSPDMKTAAKQFDVLCRMAHAAGNCALVAEELAFVTTPSQAPPGWPLCNLRGRIKGLTIYGTTQRPARVDKDFFGNATRIRCGRLNYARDIKTMADVLGVPLAMIANLKPLQYIEKDMSNGKLSIGEVGFGAIQPAARELHIGNAAGPESGPPAKKKRCGCGCRSGCGAG